MIHLKRLIFLLIYLLMIGCQVNVINENKNNIQSIELYQENHHVKNGIKISSNTYEILENNEVYTYPLTKPQWDSILKKIESIDYKKIDDYIIYKQTSAGEEGRLMMKNVKSILIIKDENGIYSTKTFDQKDQDHEVLSLYKLIESYLPLR
ncbi:hypothetical protein [Faecalibacter sp. LW9]|uniref:hypothetical protein n=1 Tax=Faecalibacter sp. LW9 TaxID=3103144 RepID=UPI002AFF489C|nr:hypothetical protein [Faecalibacter sp. LW9]